MNADRKKLVGLAVILLLLSGSLPAQLQVVEVNIAVVVNPENPVNSISSAELRKIFSAQKQWWNSSLPVTLFVRAPRAHERDIMLHKVLGMTESEYQQFWVRKVYSGEVPHEPLALYSNGMLLEAVRTEKGGIAMIDFRDVHAGVKVLKVDGLLPGAPAYPLK